MKILNALLLPLLINISWGNEMTDMDCGNSKISNKRARETSKEEELITISGQPTKKSKREIVEEPDFQVNLGSLPNELIDHILQYLPIADLKKIPGVSHDVEISRQHILSPFNPSLTRHCHTEISSEKDLNTYLQHNNTGLINPYKLGRVTLTIIPSPEQIIRLLAIKGLEVVIVAPDLNDASINVNLVLSSLSCYLPFDRVSLLFRDDNHKVEGNRKLLNLINLWNLLGTLPETGRQKAREKLTHSLHDYTLNASSFAIEEAQRYYPFISSFSIKDKGITNIKKVCELLNQDRLTSLDISGSNIFNDNQELIEALSNNKSLKSLSLDFCHIGDENAETLISKLVNIPHLAELHLDGNDISTKGSKALATLLRQSQTLVNVSLLENNINSEDCQNIAEALKVNLTLTKLGLCANRIDDIGAFALADILKNGAAPLTYLDVTANPMNEAGLNALKEALKDNKNDVELDTGEEEWPA